MKLVMILRSSPVNSSSRSGCSPSMEARHRVSSACAVANDSSHINVLHGGIGDLARLVKRGELIDARLRHSRHANVGGTASRLFLQVRPRQNAEKSCFADLR